MLFRSAFVWHNVGTDPSTSAPSITGSVSGSVTLTWTVPGTVPAGGYKAVLQEPNGTDSLYTGSSWGQTGSTGSISGLPTGDEYYIIGVDSSGNPVTKPSNIYDNRTITPDAPSSVTATGISESEVSVTWNLDVDKFVGYSSVDTGNALAVTGFQLYRNSSDDFSTATPLLTTPLSPNTTSYQDTGLTGATKYYYWVVAFGNGGTSAKTEAIAFTWATVKWDGATVPTLISSAGGTNNLQLVDLNIWANSGGTITLSIPASIAPYVTIWSADGTTALVGENADGGTISQTFTANDTVFGSGAGH